MRTLGNPLQVGLTALLLWTGACANQGLDGSDRSAQSSLQALTGNYMPVGGATGSPRGLNGDYTCTGAKNVKPDYDWDFNGSGFYQVCGHKSDASKALLLPVVSTSGRVCVFPAQAYEGRKVYVKPGLDTLPIVKCSEVSSAGLPLQFSNMTYNAVFVVAEADKNAMQACLFAGNYYACPRNWSYGTFR